MIGAVLLVVGLSWAGDTPRPSPPGPPVPGECLQSFALPAGEPVTPELVQGECVARCGGVLIPTSKTADLLRVEATTAMHIADIELLKLQRAALKNQIDQAGRPWVHKLVGGAVGVTLGLGVGLTIGAYYTGPGGS